MKHWYTIPAPADDNDITLDVSLLAVTGAHEWLILAAPGFVAIDGTYHGPDERTKPGPLPAALTAALKSEAARLGRDNFNPAIFWVKG